MEALWHSIINVLIVIIASVQISVAYSDRISVGDLLFVLAQVKGCGQKIRLVETAEVSESGDVTFFDGITLKAEDKTPEEVTGEFVALWEEKTGQQSKTIQITRETDLRSATVKMMMLYEERKRGCKTFPDNFDSPNLRDYIHLAEAAAHNKSSNTDTGDAGAG